MVLVNIQRSIERAKTKPPTINILVPEMTQITSNYGKTNYDQLITCKKNISQLSEVVTELVIFKVGHSISALPNQS